MPEMQPTKEITEGKQKQDFHTELPAQMEYAEKYQQYKKFTSII